MNLRWPLVASIIALFAGAGLAALVLAFCGDEDGGPGGPSARATPRVTVTRTAVGIRRTATPRPGTPAPTVPSEQETPVPSEDETPPAEEPTLPPPEETATPVGPPPTATPPAPRATGTASPVPPGRTPTPSPTTSALPDLVVLDLSVFHDQIVVVVSNKGGGPVPAGTILDIGVRGITAQSITLAKDLAAGASLMIVLSDQVLYRPELVVAQVDPGGRIPEADETNNTLSRLLEPDIPPDLGLTGLASVGATSNLAVDITNTTNVPIRGALVRLNVFRCDSDELVSGTNPIAVDLNPNASMRVEVFPTVALVSGVCMRVEMLILENFPDADIGNNTIQGVVP